MPTEMEDTTKTALTDHVTLVVDKGRGSFRKIANVQDLLTGAKDDCRPPKMQNITSMPVNGLQGLMSLVRVMAGSEGRWALVQGRHAPGLDLQARHPRNTRTLIDAPSHIMPIDVDRLPVPSPLGRGDKLPELAEYVRGELCLAAPEFADVAMIATPTSGTGRRGEAQCNLRLFAWLERPHTCNEKKKLVERINAALKARRSDLFLDASIYSPEHLVFTSRPQWGPGLTDPVPADQWALMLPGTRDTLALSPTTLVMRAGVSTTRHPEPDPPGSPENFAGLALPVPEARREEVLRALVAAIPNDGLFDDRDDYAGVGHAIRASSGGAPFGRDIFVDFDDRWHLGGNPDEAERVYDSLHGTLSGYDLLMELARKHGGELGRKACMPVWSHLFLLSAPSENQFTATEADNAEDAFQRALRRLREARAIPTEYSRGAGATPHLIALDDQTMTQPDVLPPEVTDRHTRGQISMLSAQPGAGKSTYTILQAVALAYELPGLLGQSFFDWMGDVVIVSNEDNEHTIRRKIRALEKKHGLASSARKHTIHVWSDPLIIAHKDGNRGRVVPTRAAVEFVEALTVLRTTQDISLVVLDTMASGLEGLNENDAPDMQAAMSIFASIARAGFLSMEVVHHEGKSENHAYRGSSAILGAVRNMARLTRPTSKEATELGWPLEQQARLVKVEGVKSNDRPKSPAQHFVFDTVPLPALDPRDRTKPVMVEGVYLQWVPVPARRSATTGEAYAVLLAAQQGGEDILVNSAKRADAPREGAKDRLVASLGIAPEQAEGLISELERNGQLVRGSKRRNRNTVAVYSVVISQSEAGRGLI